MVIQNKKDMEMTTETSIEEIHKQNDMGTTSEPEVQANKNLNDEKNNINSDDAL
jgi:hypothetical protein